MKKLLAYVAFVVAASLGALAQPVTTPPIFVPPGAPPGPLFPQMGSQTSSIYPWGNAPGYSAQYPPGRTYNTYPEGAGIPLRSTQCGATVNPLNTGASDYNNINNAIQNCVSNCSVEPTGHCHVQLGNGVFVLNNETISFGNNPSINNITVRGMGPGPGGAVPVNSGSIPNVSVCGATPCTILYNTQWMTASDSIFHMNYNSASTQYIGDSINLASDGVQGSRTVTLASAPPNDGSWSCGALLWIDVVTLDTNNSVANWPTSANPELIYPGAFPAPASDNPPWNYGFGGRYSRNINQVVKLANTNCISGNTVTLESPLTLTFAVANHAQLSSWTIATQATGLGIEEMMLYGGGGGHGNLSIELCDGCWIRHVESMWTDGDNSMSACYHCEFRDSYFHEASAYKNTTNGGAGYLIGQAEGTANSLLENNIMWNGNKVNVMQTTGGGNVIGYNFMTDDFGFGDMAGDEAGVNAGHYIGSHFELIEGNWSHDYSGDSFWGNAIYITAFRNHFTGLRYCGFPTNQAAACTWLIGFAYPNNPYTDCEHRTPVRLMFKQWWHNIIGNVLGNSAQGGLNTAQNIFGSGFSCNQSSYQYESPDALDQYDIVYQYTMGMTQSNTAPNGGSQPTEPTLYQKINRQGNWDQATSSQIWYSTYGGHGSTSTGSPMTLPNSLYLRSKPAFFGTKAWPWVNPATGSAPDSGLPAADRFMSRTPNLCLNPSGNICLD